MQSPRSRRVSLWPTSAWFPLPIPRLAPRLLPRNRPALRCHNRARRALACALLIALAACKPAEPERPQQVVGLSTSLPLIWGEAGDIRGQLAADAPVHWAMALLKTKGRVVPLDTLADPRGGLPLPGDALLVLAQPLPLTPQENVALDAWVRGGGRLLLFADPMLTAHSVFALGDPRGPQRVAMLSPILRHWGLELQFDAAQPTGDRVLVGQDMSLPVNLAGRFSVGSQVRCRIDVQGVVVRCSIGKGLVLAVGDAAVFDGDDAGRSAALTSLLAQLDR